MISSNFKERNDCKDCKEVFVSYFIDKRKWLTCFLCMEYDGNMPYFYLLCTNNVELLGDNKTSY